MIDMIHVTDHLLDCSYHFHQRTKDLDDFQDFVENGLKEGSCLTISPSRPMMRPN